MKLATSLKLPFAQFVSARNISFTTLAFLSPNHILTCSRHYESAKKVLKYNLSIFDTDTLYDKHLDNETDGSADSK